METFKFRNWYSNIRRRKLNFPREKILPRSGSFLRRSSPHPFRAFLFYSLSFLPLLFTLPRFWLQSFRNPPSTGIYPFFQDWIRLAAILLSAMLFSFILPLSLSSFSAKRFSAASSHRTLWNLVPRQALCSRRFQLEITPGKKSCLPRENNDARFPERDFESKRFSFAYFSFHVPFFHPLSFPSSSFVCLSRANRRFYRCSNLARLRYRGQRQVHDPTRKLYYDLLFWPSAAVAYYSHLSPEFCPLSDVPLPLETRWSVFCVLSFSSLPHCAVL